ncbi:MAG: WYL domain-containing protein, partial [Dehalococcoidia bacterium]|nr:WYL domain-containing protein [Dehalococcoidia bacterium]
RGERIVYAIMLQAFENRPVLLGAAMEEGQSLSRATRLSRIQHYLYGNPQGLTTGELARLCGVCIRTIQRDLLDLQSALRIPIGQTGDRYSILEGYILPPVSFSLYEAAVLFLASRLILRQTDENNPHIRTAMQKLASVLPSDLAKRLDQGIQSMKTKPANPEYVRVFEQVALAWSTQRRMQFKYLSLQSAETKRWVIDPYFIEMTGTGYSTYVMGKVVSGEREGIITFKLDRMREVRLLEESFETPEGLSLDGLLGSSWGVIWGKEVEVKLSFSSKVTRRVKESTWHPSQVIEGLPDGGCIMTVRVGSALEMTPWIRGWGADVEVLGPEGLRGEMAGWARQLREMYAPALKQDI